MESTGRGISRNSSPSKGGGAAFFNFAGRFLAFHSSLGINYFRGGPPLLSLLDYYGRLLRSACVSESILSFQISLGNISLVDLIYLVFHIWGESVWITMASRRLGCPSMVSCITQLKEETGNERPGTRCQGPA